MYKFSIPDSEYYDEQTERFIQVKAQTICLEHSLVSISKWESKWKKPFVTEKEKTMEELRDYIRCMTLTQNVDPNVYKCLGMDVIQDILAYIEDPMTATTFSNNKKEAKKGEFITSELVYYWMTALNIPMECQKWHFNRLMTLIRIAGEKNQPPKKMSKNEILSRNKALNAQRRAKLHSKG